MGGHRGQIDAVLATLPITAQDQLKTIRDSYKAKIDILRTAEKSEIDSILTAYPEAKTKLDALESSREPSMGMMKRHGRRGADFSHESADTMTGMSPISQ